MGSCRELDRLSVALPDLHWKGGRASRERSVTSSCDGLSQVPKWLACNNFHGHFLHVCEVVARPAGDRASRMWHREGKSERTANDTAPKNIKLRRHEFRTAQYDDITYSIWVDTKPVLTLSNYHSPEQMGFVTRRGASGQRERVPVPAVLESYQQNMKGVDLMDQMVGYYMLHHRSQKWWRRIFYYLLATSVHNSYVVAKDTYPEEMQRQHPTFVTFLEDVAIGLIGDYKSKEEQRLHQRVQHPLVIHEVVAHLFEKNKVCRECSDQAQPGERSGVTHYSCRQCRVAVHPKCQTAHQRRHSGNQ